MVSKAYLAPQIFSLLLMAIPTIKYRSLSHDLPLVYLVYAIPFAALYFLGKYKAADAHSPPAPLGISPNEDQFAKIAKTRSAIYQVSRFLAYFYLVIAILTYLVFGTVLDEGITGSRYSNIAAGGGSSVTGALEIISRGGPVFLISLQLIRATHGMRINRFDTLISALGLLMYFGSGGRNAFLIALAYIFFIYLLTRRGAKFPLLPENQKKNLNRNIKTLRRFLAPTLLIGAAVSAWIFIERASIRSDSLVERAFLLSMESDIDIAQLDTSSEALYSVYFVWVYAQFYFTQAFSNTSFYLDSSTFPLTMGGYMFYTPCWILDRLTGLGFCRSVPESVTLFGRYHGLPGTLFVDFGLVGLFLVSSLIAALSVFVGSTSLRRGGERFVFLAAFFLTVGAVSPLYSLFATASGPSIAIWSLIFIFLRKVRF